MPLDAGTAGARAESLNERYRHHGAKAVLEGALRDVDLGRVALVSSFGAESVVLLHLVSVVERHLPIVFLDTEMLFAETLVYQQELTERLRLEDVRIVRPERRAAFERDPDGLLHQGAPDSCCHLRKVEPLARALEGFDGWITGRKRYQGGRRAALEFFEAADGRIKVNPLAHWAPSDLADYIAENRLPRHPLVAQGYGSIGCTPCTTRIAAGEEARAGRWRGRDKEECGIHFENGRLVRGLEKDDIPMKMDVKVDVNVIVTDAGFGRDTHPGGFRPLAEVEGDAAGLAVELPPDTSPDSLDRVLGAAAIRIDFPSFADGRGFTLARLLRLKGFGNRLRASGHVIADQYAMARRAGFDEVEIDADLAVRQPEPQWLARADWRAHDYQSRLRAFA